MEKRRICIVTTTRADWGLLCPLARRLQADSRCELSVVAGNMHLDPRYGMTVNEIEADGFRVAARVPLTPADDTPGATAMACGDFLSGIAGAFAQIRPDIVVILGDRFEMLPVATAATVMGIPIAHIAGGEITEGAIDDNVRHALTKLSYLHFTATDEYRRRVIQMGEEPCRVIDTGALGVYNMLNERLMDKATLETSVGMEFTPGALLVTLHPATRDTVDAATRCRALLDALDRFPASKVLFTHPNNDPDGRVIIGMTEEYAHQNPERVTVVPSLGRVRYLSALRQVSAVVGNSSSGLVEVPAAGIPTVDIGIRQQGRAAGPSVIHCEADADSIAAAIARALSSDCPSAPADNPYYKPDTPGIMAACLLDTPLPRPAIKHFHQPDHTTPQ